MINDIDGGYETRRLNIPVPIQPPTISPMTKGVYTNSYVPPSGTGDSRGASGSSGFDHYTPSSTGNISLPISHSGAMYDLSATPELAITPVVTTKQLCRACDQLFKMSGDGCKTCNQIFGLKRQLCDRCHTALDSRGMLCKICHKVFSSTDRLFLHLSNIHTVTLE